METVFISEVSSFLSSFFLLPSSLPYRECIIDKNARVGKNVIIANSEVKNSFILRKMAQSDIQFLFVYLISTYVMVCREYKKQIGHPKDFTSDLALQ